MLDFGLKLKSAKMGLFWPKSKAIHLDFLPKLGPKMGHFWPKSNAIYFNFLQKIGRNKNV